jgi:hypothetical protein
LVHLSRQLLVTSSTQKQQQQGAAANGVILLTLMLLAADTALPQARQAGVRGRVEGGAQEI